MQQAAEARAAEREAADLARSRRAQIEKNFLLQMVDMQWREHLTHLDHLKNVIGLRGYGQRDPLNEYKTEAFSLFEKLIGDLRPSVTRWLMTVEFRFAPPDAAAAAPASSKCTSIPQTGENERAPLSLAGDVGAARRQRAALPPRRPARRLASAPAATPPAPAAPARSSSTATARWSRQSLYR